MTPEAWRDLAMRAVEVADRCRGWLPDMGDLEGYPHCQDELAQLLCDLETLAVLARKAGVEVAP